jgi:GTP cyclohydrolase I
MWHGYMYITETYSTIKKNEMMSIAEKWMELEIIIFREITQTEKDRHHMLSLICRI